jgi:hypothetical protein
MTATIINKTPHPVTLVDNQDKVVKTFPACPKEELIRLSAKTVPAKELDGIPTSRTEFGSAIGLPDFEEGVYYIVSQLVKSAKADRNDLLVPAEVVRDSNGQIIGCKSLGR